MKVPFHYIHFWFSSNFSTEIMLFFLSSSSFLLYSSLSFPSFSLLMAKTKIFKEVVCVFFFSANHFCLLFTVQSSGHYILLSYTTSTQSNLVQATHIYSEVILKRFSCYGTFVVVEERFDEINNNNKKNK